jgi:hypothetical protein
MVEASSRLPAWRTAGFGANRKQNEKPPPATADGGKKGFLSFDKTLDDGTGMPATGRGLLAGLVPVADLREARGLRSCHAARGRARRAPQGGSARYARTRTRTITKSSGRRSLALAA